MKKIALLTLAALLQATPAALQADELPKVLFFSNPMSSDNDVIRRPKSGELSVAEKHFTELSRGVFEVTLTQDGADVVKDRIPRYRAIVFFTAINPPGVDRDSLLSWVAGGGAFIGIHSTANTFQGHPEFGRMLGANFDRRPWRTAKAPQTRVILRVNDSTHPSTRHLDASFPYADDIYQFKNFDRTKVRLLLSLDPAGLDLANPKVNAADRDFPVAWVKSHGEGRVFYTALGDWEETWKDPRYRTHLIQGLLWAMKATPEK